jgi:hypothetical protein
MRYVSGTRQGLMPNLVGKGGAAVWLVDDVHSGRTMRIEDVIIDFEKQV